MKEVLTKLDAMQSETTTTTYSNQILEEKTIAFVFSHFARLSRVDDTLAFYHKYCAFRTMTDPRSYTTIIKALLSCNHSGISIHSCSCFQTNFSIEKAWELAQEGIENSVVPESNISLVIICISFGLI